jgi:hypothetical protein
VSKLTSFIEIFSGLLRKGREGEEARLENREISLGYGDIKLQQPTSTQQKNTSYHQQSLPTATPMEPHHHGIPKYQHHLELRFGGYSETTSVSDENKHCSARVLRFSRL